MGLILSNLPIREYQLIGQYYCAWCAYRSGDVTPLVFEKVVEESTTHRASALITLAALEARKANYEAEQHFLLESLKYSDSLSTAIRAYKGIAVVKAKEGYHQAALKDLETLYPMVRHASADVYYDFLNSYAVELGESGRKSEAQNIIKHVLASPFAFAYPEWQETAKYLREPNRSFVAVPLIKREQVKIEETEANHTGKPEPPAEVIPFKLKEAPEPKMPDKLSPQEMRELSLIEKRDLILSAIRAGQMNEFEYDKLIVAVGLLKDGPAEKILDLEDEETLDDIAVIWAVHIGPDALAGVLSALRDCHDSLRRNEIIDRMIKKAFQQTQLSGLTEEAWRLRVERRLPEK